MSQLCYSFCFYDKNRYNSRRPAQETDQGVLSTLDLTREQSSKFKSKSSDSTERRWKRRRRRRRRKKKNDPDVCTCGVAKPTKSKVYARRRKNRIRNKIVNG